MIDVPLISVIVPAYNAEQWLKECCESVLHQTYSNIELIIVDDGSTDGTFDAANQIAFGRKNVLVIHTKNGGVCRARNIGLDAATGKYVAFLDSDDALVDNALEILYSNIVETSADIAIGWKTNMTADGVNLGCPFKRVSGVFSGIQGLKLSLEDHPSMYAVWGKLYKRTIIEDIKFVEGKKVHEDSFFVFECLLKQPKVVICDSIVLRYRLSENSASRSVFSDKYLDILYFAQKKQEAIKKEYPELFSLSENVIVKANMALLWNLLRTNDRKYKEIQKNAIKSVQKRKRFYRTAIKSDAKLFWLLTHHLYGTYKMLHIVRSIILEAYNSYKN